MGKLVLKLKLSALGPIGKPNAAAQTCHATRVTYVTTHVRMYSIQLPHAEGQPGTAVPLASELKPVCTAPYHCALLVCMSSAGGGAVPSVQCACRHDALLQQCMQSGNQQNPPRRAPQARNVESLVLCTQS
jgi:hypothetical protein